MVLKELIVDFFSEIQVHTHIHAPACSFIYLISINLIPTMQKDSVYISQAFCTVTLAQTVSMVAEGHGLFTHLWSRVSSLALCLIFYKAICDRKGDRFQIIQI